ncbi:radical SAM protein [Trichocoleus desertorum AS-A10]|uniref:radical SAM/SPASM domain-containing protein n=1 Tax=Trichocoleus desertorum TaxID=1481672 RepID=UPI003298C54D
MSILPIDLISEVETLYRASAPQLPQVHFFETDYGLHTLVADGSQVYAVTPELRQEIEIAAQTTPEFVNQLLAECGLTTRPFIEGQPLENPPLRSLSLAVAQKCNLGCTYCYAQEGGFGEAAKSMSWEIAKASVERLFEDTQAGDRVNLSFMGGEPLVNRQLIQAATQLAAEFATAKQVKVGFGITTNGTLLTPDDAAFFERYGFAVTVSMDGVGETHDRLRPFKSGNGSFDRIVANLKPLLANQHRMQVSARVTVTPQNLTLRDTLDQLIDMGFHSVGFSPMLSSPTGKAQMEVTDLDLMLEQMIECGREFERQTIAGHRYPFSNLTLAMQQIHRGTHRPYPCGAGAGYMGVSANGNLWACHRFVNDEVGLMGDLTTGLNRERQNEWLAQRQVDLQEPCKGCWARYLCGGGCHHEVIHRGRPACDYIRGWLHFCLQTYINLMEQCPDYFTSVHSTSAV